MKNRIFSVLAGVFAGWFTVGTGEMINHKLLPAPQNFDYTNKEALRGFIDGLPTSAFLSMLLVYAISAYVGGVVTGKLAKSNWTCLCLITGGVLLIANIINMLMIPHPFWFNIVAVLLYFPLAYLGGKTVHKNTN